MNLIDLITQNFFVFSKDMSLLYKYEKIVQNDDFELLVNDESEDSASTFLATAEIQKKTTMEGGIESLGFDNLIESLSSLDPDYKIGAAVVYGKKWAGRLHYKKDVSPNHFIAMILVKRRHLKRPKVPQNWDGTNETLGET